MGRALGLLFSLLAYAIFFLTFLYMIAFVADLPFVPMTVDNAPAGPVGLAIATDAALIALFGVQHSSMARRSFKALWTRLVPAPVERSMFVLTSSLVLIFLFAEWRAVPGTVWHVDHPWGRAALWALFGLGWAIVLLSTFLINHFELFGLAQAWRNLRGRIAAPPRFYTPLLYRLVRHPLYLGFFIAFWATPHMSFGHALLAVGMSAYMLIAIPIEERDLVDSFGDTYRDYQGRVGMLLPRLGRQR